MKTILGLVRIFKNKFAFVDELVASKEGQLRLSWPSLTSPVRFFPEEGLYKIQCKDGWVIRAEKARVKAKVFILTNKHTTAQIWAGVNSVLKEEVIVDELIIEADDEHIIKKVETLLKGKVRLIKRT
ncbi:MAG: hypothetical protein QXG91_05060 [Candidatus Aenigmatarchaeota archaeon]